jgi:hypothetical protein
MTNDIQKEKKIHGTVFAAAWDDKNNVIQVVVDTPDQDEFLIDPKGKGKELLDCLRREVEVIGTLKEDPSGDFVVNVKEYRLVKPSSEIGEGVTSSA